MQNDQIKSESLEEEIASSPLRVIPFTQRTFKAGGHTYFVEEALSIERYKHFQRMEIELGFSMKFSEMIAKMHKAYNLANESKLADVSVLLHGILEGATFIGEKKPIALYVATLFINKSDEDRGTWSQTLAEEKLADWNGRDGEKGIDINFFLAVALSKVENFDRIWIELSETLDRLDPIKGKGMSEE